MEIISDTYITTLSNSSSQCGKKRAKQAKPISKLSCKERSKIHRERKKRYYLELEKKVETLELEVQTLRVENEELKNQKNVNRVLQNPPENDFPSFLDEERSDFEEFPEFFSETPVFQKEIMLSENKGKYESYNADRVNLLKQAFRTIIDNIIPVPQKSAFLMFTETSLPKIMKCWRNKDQHRKPYKFYRDEIGMNQVEEVFKHANFSESFLDVISETHQECHLYLKSIRYCVQDLVMVRNKLLSLLKENGNFQYHTQIFEKMSTQDVAELEKISQTLIGSNLLNPVKLWGLSPKLSPSDEYANDELSD